jgi:hypothetical protein
VDRPPSAFSVAASSFLPATQGQRSTDAMARLGYPQVKKELDFILSAESPTGAVDNRASRTWFSREAQQGHWVFELVDE